MRKADVIVLTGVLLSSAAIAAPRTPSSSDVTISNAWFRALPAKLPAAGYFDLRNDGKITAHLTGAASPACGMLMLHKSSEKGGMSSMEDVQSIDVAPGATVKFAPGGYHLMCMEPTAAMKPGASVAVTLKFSDGSVATAKFAVKNTAGK
ncbi:MAG TPA: copper chaperone PCu(A)C [Rhizomicrobium sp.]|jgi:hypothetical protein